MGNILPIDLQFFFRGVRFEDGGGTKLDINMQVFDLIFFPSNRLFSQIQREKLFTNLISGRGWGNSLKMGGELTFLENIHPCFSPTSFQNIILRIFTPHLLFRNHHEESHSKLGFEYRELSRDQVVHIITRQISLISN